MNKLALVLFLAGLDRAFSIWDSLADGSQNVMTTYQSPCISLDRLTPNPWDSSFIFRKHASFFPFSSSLSVLDKLITGLAADYLTANPPRR